MRGPDELVEGMNGITMPRRNASPWDLLTGRGSETVSPPVQRYEVDLTDPRSYEEQMYDQSFLRDPSSETLLAPDFDIDALAEQVTREAGRRR